jgi:hypothetical protein
MVPAGWSAGLDRHGGQLGKASIADGADAFQGHVADALRGPLTRLL